MFHCALERQAPAQTTEGCGQSSLSSVSSLETLTFGLGQSQPK